MEDKRALERAFDCIVQGLAFPSGSMSPASNGEIFAYVQAYERLQFNADLTAVFNPSAMEIWFEADGETHSVAPGQYYRF